MTRHEAQGTNDCELGGRNVGSRMPEFGPLQEKKNDEEQKKNLREIGSLE